MKKLTFVEWLKYTKEEQSKKKTFNEWIINYDKRYFKWERNYAMRVIDESKRFYQMI